MLLHRSAFLLRGRGERDARLGVWLGESEGGVESQGPFSTSSIAALAGWQRVRRGAIVTCARVDHIAFTVGELITACQAL